MTDTPNHPATSPPPPEKITEDSAARRPSRGLYGLAVVILLVGLAAFVASINVARMQVHAFENSLQRLVAPGTATLRFEKPGEYFIYYEKVGEFEGRAFDTRQVLPGRPNEMPRLHVGLHDAEGAVVPLAQAHETNTHMYGHGRANSEFTFTITQPGDYTLTTSHANPISDELLLAVGPPVAHGVMSDWTGPFGGASILAFSLVISAVLALVTWALRHGKMTRRED